MKKDKPTPVKNQVVFNIDPTLHKKLVAQSRAESRTIRQQVVHIVTKHFA